MGGHGARRGETPHQVGAMAKPPFSVPREPPSRAVGTRSRIRWARPPLRPAGTHCHGPQPRPGGEDAHLDARRASAQRRQGFVAGSGGHSGRSAGREIRCHGPQSGPGGNDAHLADTRAPSRAGRDSGPDPVGAPAARPGGRSTATVRCGKAAPLYARPASAQRRRGLGAGPGGRARRFAGRGIRCHDPQSGPGGKAPFPRLEGWHSSPQFAEPRRHFGSPSPSFPQAEEGIAFAARKPAAGPGPPRPMRRLRPRPFHAIPLRHLRGRALPAIHGALRHEAPQAWAGAARAKAQIGGTAPPTGLGI